MTDHESQHAHGRARPPARGGEPEVLVEGLSDEDEAFVEAADRDPYGIATEEGPTEGHVVNAFGGDWDDVVDEAASLGEERIVVNMGPQHPSTHGVLRLILEIDGETVTETRAGIGYLHTGIEKNMEFRTWTQGVTFCTRMDYLTPMFQETAYCLGVEKLLGVTDQIPERATVIRVLMMELTRISSHLVALATGGMEMGATTVMTVGFRERERILAVIELITGLRMNNAFIRPGGVAQDTPSGAIDRIRDMVPLVRKGLRELELLLLENPILKGRTVDVGYLDLTGCIALGITGPILRSTGLPHDLRKLSPYCGYETYEFDVDHPGELRRLRPAVRPAGRDARVAEDRRAVRGPPAGPRGAGDGRGQEDRLAGPAGPRQRRPGQLAGPHQEHHGHLDGVADPPLQAGHRGLPGAARPGLLGGRVGQGRARACTWSVDGGTRPYRAHFRDPSFNNLQSAAAMCEGSQIADVIVAVASIDPVMGGVDR